MFPPLVLLMDHGHPPAPWDVPAAPPPPPPPPWTGRKHIAGTHKPGSPQPVDHGGKPTPGIRDDQAAVKETQPHLTQVLKRPRGVPLRGGPLPRAGLGAPGALLGVAAAVRRACSLPDPLHLTHFLFFTQLPADNKLSIWSPQEHLQLSSLSPPQHGPVRIDPSSTVHARAVRHPSIAVTALTREAC